MRLSCSELVHLRAGDYAASVAPAAGGRVASLACSHAGRTIPLLVAWDGRPFDEHDWPKAGAFPMLPFANRLPREGFRFLGRHVQPHPGPAGVALHGLAHRRPWRLLESSASRALLRFAHDGDAAGWPWPWTAEQEVTLGAGGLTVTLRVRNDGPEPMPLGMGWHPYHPVSSGVTAGDLRFSAQARHGLDAQGWAGDGDLAAGFSMRRGETAAYAGWPGQLGLRTAEAGEIRVAATGADALVLHRPASGDYLCAEPVTVLPGWLGAGSPAATVGVLPAGGTRQLSWTCTFAPAGPSW